MHAHATPPRFNPVAMIAAGIPLVDIIRRWLSEERLKLPMNLTRIGHLKVALKCSPAIEITAITGVYQMAPLIAARKRADENRMEQERVAAAESLTVYDSGPMPVPLDEILSRTPVSPGDIDGG